MNATLREFTKEFSPWGRKATADEMRKAVKTERGDITARFATESEGLRESFEATKNVRDINSHQGHYFLHTVALETTGRANTTANNEAIATANLTAADAVRLVLAGGLSLSCSAIPREDECPRPERSFKTVKPGETNWYSTGRRSGEDVKTMYPFGVIFKEGTILAAYRNDAGSLIEAGKKHRKSKYDKAVAHSAIQKNIEPAISHALEPLTRFRDYEDRGAQKMGRDLNEIVIANTKPASLFLNLDDPWAEAPENPGAHNFGNRVRALTKEVEGLARKFSEIPMMVQHKGKIETFTLDAEGLKSPSGRGIGEIVEEMLEAQEKCVTTFGDVEFSGVQAHMWASGEMTRTVEEEYIGKGIPEKDLLVKDSTGKTALHLAAETGRSRHVPEELLKKYAEVKGPDGKTLEEAVDAAKKPLQETALEEAKMRSTHLTPFKTGPVEITGTEGKRIWAVGNTPDGGVLCTDSRGSSTACGLDWHLGSSLLKHLYTSTEKKGQSTTALETLAEEYAGKGSTFNPEWIQQQKLAKELLAFAQTPSPASDPELPGKTTMIALSTEKGPTRTLQEAQKTLVNPNTLDAALEKIRATTNTIQSAWTRLFEKKTAEIA